MTGAVVCGLAQSMAMLIAGRAIQGLGAGAIPLAMAVIGDLDRAARARQVAGLTGAAFGVASVVGPATGGRIADNANWRWAFFGRLPFGVLAHARAHRGRSPGQLVSLLVLPGGNRRPRRPGELLLLTRPRSRVDERGRHARHGCSSVSGIRARMQTYVLVRGERRPRHGAATATTQSSAPSGNATTGALLTTRLHGGAFTGSILSGGDAADRDALAAAMHTVFVASVPLVALAFVATLSSSRDASCAAPCTSRPPAPARSCSTSSARVRGSRGRDPMTADRERQHYNVNDARRR